MFWVREGRGVNMHEMQIYIKKHLKQKKLHAVGDRGGDVSQLGGLYPPP